MMASSFALCIYIKLIKWLNTIKIYFWKFKIIDIFENAVDKGTMIRLHNTEYSFRPQ